MVQDLHMVPPRGERIVRYVNDTSSCDYRVFRHFMLIIINYNLYAVQSKQIALLNLEKI